MTVSDLIEKLSQVPQDLEVHVMADLQRDLVNIASIDLITAPFTDEPFVVIDLRREDRSVVLEDTAYEEHDAFERQDYSPKFLKN
jgi:hypothetical protein